MPISINLLQLFLTFHVNLSIHIMLKNMIIACMEKKDAPRNPKTGSIEHEK